MWFDLDKFFKEEEQEFEPVSSYMENIYNIIKASDDEKNLKIYFEYSNNNHVIGFKTIKNNAKQYFIDDFIYENLQSLFEDGSINSEKLSKLNNIIYVSKVTIDSIKNNGR